MKYKTILLSSVLLVLFIPTVSADSNSEFRAASEAYNEQFREAQYRYAIAKTNEARCAILKIVIKDSERYIRHLTVHREYNITQTWEYDLIDKRKIKIMDFISNVDAQKQKLNCHKTIFDNRLYW